MHAAEVNPPPESSPHVEGVRGPARQLWLPPSFAALLALGLGGAAALLRTRVSADVVPLLKAVTWAAAGNLFSAALIGAFAWRAGWTRRIGTAVAFDQITSALSVLLLVEALAIEPEPRMHAFGFTYGLLVALKAAVLAGFAIANAGAGTPWARRAWVFAASALVFGSATGWTTRVSYPEGDGPAYLILAHSLVADRDVDLRNNYAQRDYLRFYPAEMPGKVFGYPLAARIHDSQTAVSQDHHTVPGRDGQELLWHDVGPSMILAPGYAVARRVGAYLTVNLVGAALALAIFELASMLAGALSALLAWALFAFSAPLLVFSGEIFPEIMGAAGIAWAAVLFLKYARSGSRGDLAAVGVLLALLPWICIRYWITGGVLFAVVAAHLLWSAKRLGLGTILGRAWPLVLPGLLSVVFLAGFSHAHFGVWLPNAGYHAIVSQQPQFWSRLDIGLMGLLFDGAFGLLPFAPVYLVAFAGVWVLVRRDGWAAAAILLPALGYTVFMSSSRFWYGGYAPPARYLVAGIALLPAASALVLGSRRTRLLALALAAWGWLAACVYVAIPIARYPSIYDVKRSGLDELLRGAIGFHLDDVFPSMARAAARDYVALLGWVMVGALCTLFVVRHGSAGPARPMASGWASRDERP